MRKIIRQFILDLALLFLSSNLVWAGTPLQTTFQTRIVTPLGSLLESPSVDFRFTILDSSGTCALYVEDYVGVNMSGSQGVASFSLGTGAKQYPIGPVAMHEVFNNGSPFFLCQAGGTYTPIPTDRRQVVMQFNDGSGWQTLPQMAINSVPFSFYANRADNLGAYPAADYLRSAMLPVCSVGQALKYDGSSLTCTNLTYTSSSIPGISNISNSSGDITLAPILNTGQVTINSGTPSLGATSGALVISGGLGLSGSLNSGGNIVSSGSITSNGNISANMAVFTPQIYGTTTPSGSISIDSTADSLKGRILLAPAGGKVAIGTSSPQKILDVNGLRNGTGTATATGGSSTVTGSGTLFASEIEVGDSILFSGDARTVISIASDTSLGIDTPFPGTYSNSVFSIRKPISFNTGAAIFGDTTALRVHSSSIFGDVVPAYEFVAPNNQSWSSFTDLMVFRHKNSGTYNVSQPQRMAFLMKMGNEAGTGDAYGGGGMAFETSSGFMANPTLSLINGNARRLTVASTGNIGIGTMAPTSLLHTVASGAKTTAYTAHYFSNTASSSTASVSKIGVDIQSTGTWNGTSAVNTGLNVNVSGGTTNNAAIFSGGRVGIGTTSPQTTLQVAGVIAPATNNLYTLGSASYRFTEVYATNGVINTSDRREKKDINESNLGLSFINSLRPVSYRWNTEVDKDIHYGLIAQETEAALIQAGESLKTSMKTSIVTYDEKTDRYGVRYSELISPLIKSVQEVYQKLIKLEEKNKEIEKLRQENAEIKLYLCSKDRSAAFCQ
jgi:hypothetical protein